MKEKHAALLKRSPKVEAIHNFFKVAVPVAVPISILGLAGMDLLDLSMVLGHEIFDNISNSPIAFVSGFAVGLIKNEIFKRKTIAHLTDNNKVDKHRTNKSILISTDHENAVAEIQCSDIRILSKDGGHFPGSYAMFGAELTSILMAGAVGGLTPDNNPIANFAVGYNIGANVITGYSAIVSLFEQIDQLVQQAKIQTFNDDVNLKILMRNHRNGCGAEGITSLLSYYLKFMSEHKNHLKQADKAAIMNEIMGFAFVNSLSWIITAKYKGKVSLTASIEPSAMAVS